MSAARPASPPLRLLRLISAAHFFLVTFTFLCTMTKSLMLTETKTLPSQTYAIQVHRQHAVRVRDELEQAASQAEWVTLANESVQKDDADEVDEASLSWNHGIGDIESLPPTEQTTCIPSPKEYGARKVRTGYNMIITQNAAFSPGDLPPLARQHISWAGRVTHQTNAHVVDDNSSSTDADGQKKSALNDLCSSVAALAFQQLKEFSFVFAETKGRRADELRLDVRPKSFALPLCQALQRLAVEAKIPLRLDTDPNDPFDGPLRMTRSIVKSAYILNAVFDSLIENASDDSPIKNIPTMCFWGIAPTPEHATMINKLNDFAKKEVRIAKPDDTTCDDATPTSRAYYKLQQVFNQYFTPTMLSDEMGGLLGAGLDLGASPGGWSQVLYQNAFRPVISIDPGLLAPRVERLEGVRYIKGDFNGDDAVIREIANASPYTAIVCDANITHGCDKKIMEMINRVAGELEKKGSESASSSLITLPAVVVLTLKFAYKTEQSMKRNYAAAMNMIPTLLTSIVDGQCRTENSICRDHISCRYTVCHLHANSDSERTVLAIFEETAEGRKRKRDIEETTG